MHNESICKRFYCVEEIRVIEEIIIGRLTMALRMAIITVLLAATSILGQDTDGKQGSVMELDTPEEAMITALRYTGFDKLSDFDIKKVSAPEKFEFQDSTVLILGGVY